jgi:type IV secretory pathway VirB3-like protein
VGIYNLCDWVFWLRYCLLLGVEKKKMVPQFMVKGMCELKNSNFKLPLFCIPFLGFFFIICILECDFFFLIYLNKERGDSN